MAASDKYPLPPFHHAFPVDDIEAARAFYCDVLGCAQGRVDPGVWLDFNLFGHQVVAHKAPEGTQRPLVRNHVDGHNVPVPHFGCVLHWDQFDEFVARLREKGVKFEIEPYLRFEGKPGEQRTCFFLDPAKNALEFKCFKNPASLFAT